jgi:hypothetical protein
LAGAEMDTPPGSQPRLTLPYTILPSPTR